MQCSKFETSGASNKTPSRLLGIILGIPISGPWIRMAFVDACACGRVRSQGWRSQLRGHHQKVIHSAIVKYIIAELQEPSQRNTIGDYSIFCAMLEPYCMQTTSTQIRYSSTLPCTTGTSNSHLEDPEGYPSNYFGGHTKTSSYGQVCKFVCMYVCRYACGCMCVCTHMCLPVYFYITCVSIYLCIYPSIHTCMQGR